MAKDTVSNKELYEAIMGVHERIDELVEKRITPLEIWQANIAGKIAVIGAILIIFVNLSVDWIKERLKI